MTEQCGAQLVNIMPAVCLQGVFFLDLRHLTISFSTAQCCLIVFHGTVDETCPRILYLFPFLCGHVCSFLLIYVLIPYLTYVSEKSQMVSLRFQ